jgi:DNA-binding SARP family transcriptional activator/tetratricopeptide (TPR) repeat protein
MFCLKTFGGALLDGPQGARAGAASQPRRIAVLAILAASRPGVSRDRIVGMLWPESAEERARHALSQFLYSLRRDLGEDVIVASPTLLQLDRTRVSSDVDELEDALRRSDLEHAVDLYGGPFLDGFYLNGCPDFERWVEEERARLARRVDEAFEQLARRAREAGDAGAEAQWLSRLAARAPLDSHVALSLIKAMAASGNRTGALRHARLHEARVRQELGVAPDHAITTLVQELSASGAAEPRLPARIASAQPGADAAPPDPTNPSPAPVPPRSAIGRGARRVAIAAAGFIMVAVAVTIATGGLANVDAGKPRDWALIADVENSTGDAVFDRTVPVALAASLAESRTVYVLPPTRIQTALERMRRAAPDTVLHESLARELAEREGVAVVIVPTVVRADSSYEIGARLVEPSTGGILGAVTVRANRRTDVIDALDRLGRGVRRELGEPALYVASHSTRLPKVTTPSLDALKKFADGSRAFQSNRLHDAESLWKEAVSIDSNFASALAALGAYNFWTNRQAIGDAYFTRAIAHLGGMPEREQVLVRARAESWRGDRDSSTKLLSGYLSSHPDDIDALGMLAYDYVRMRRSADAVTTLSRLAALDSTDYGTFVNLATAERQLDRYPEAIAHYHRAFALMPSLESANNNVNLEFGAAFVATGQLDSAAAVFSELLKSDPLTRARGLRSLAFLAMYRGRYAQACNDLADALDLLRPGVANVSVVRNRLLLAAAYGRRGIDRASRAQLDSAFALTTRFDAEPTLLLWVGEALARVGQVGRAEQLRDAMRPRIHEGSGTDRAAWEELAGELLVARHRAKEAIPHLEAALRADSTNFTIESLAYALASSGQLDRAGSRYRQLAVNPEFGWEGQEYWHGALYNLGRIEELRGDTTAAIDAYGRFTDLWRDGDQGLPVVEDAKARVARLQSVERGRQVLQGTRAPKTSKP